MPEFSRSKLVRRAIFSYSTEHLPKKDKVRFFYALKGRGEKAGIIERSDAEQVGRAVIFVECDNADKVEDFLKQLHCNFSRKEVFTQHG